LGTVCRDRRLPGDFRCPPFFTLREMVSQTYAGPEDVLNVKRVLNRMGFYDVPDYGMTPHADRTMFDGIRRFQRAKGLTVDGVMQRGHATERAMNDGLRLAHKAPPFDPRFIDCATPRREIARMEAELKSLEAQLRDARRKGKHARIRNLRNRISLTNYGIRGAKADLKQCGKAVRVPLPPRPTT